MSIKLNKSFIIQTLFKIFLIGNILVLSNVNYFYTSTLLSFIVFLLIPGYLIYSILKLPKIPLWESIIFYIGFGIIFIELSGLFLNETLQLFNVTNPLSINNTIFGEDFLIFLLFIATWIRNKRLTFNFKLSKISVYQFLIYLIPLLFVLLSVEGAISINNGGSNILTLVLLFSISLYSLLLVIFRNKVSENLIIYSIYFIGLSLLFTTSLRGWFISGHDIQREYYVYNLTNTNSKWDMAFYKDAYNACLSITILPTILQHVLMIKDIYVFKVIFQCIFAFVPILAYKIIRKFTIPILAFISTIFFFSFPTFFNDMPFLNRQEIGFLFFGLALYILFVSNFSTNLKRLLIYVFSAGVIISHYSTNYVLIVLFLTIYLMTFIFSIGFIQSIVNKLLSISKHKPVNFFKQNKIINLILILLIIFTTYLWNTQFTQTSNNLSTVLSKVVTSFFLKSNDTKSSDVSYSLVNSSKITPQQNLQNYMTQTSNILHEQNPYEPAYTASDYKNYPTLAVDLEQLAPTKIGNILDKIHIPVFTIQSLLRTLSSTFMQLFVLIGLIAIIFKRNIKRIDRNYLYMSLAGLILLVLVILLPDISAEYGLLRMFQQLLFLFSFLIVFAVYFILPFFNANKRIISTAIVALIFFLTLTGFFSHITGEYYPTLTLDNSGAYYDAYYVTAQNVAALDWLSVNDPQNFPVQSNFPAIITQLKNNKIQSITDVFPQAMLRNSYVFLSTNSNFLVTLSKDNLVYTSPKPFLDAKKNLVYNNGSNYIYK